MRSLVLAVFAAAVAFAFGLPGTPSVPDVPDVEIPDIQIPGMELLDQVQVKLDGLLEQTEVLRTAIPDLAVLDQLSVKLEELRDTDEEMASLQAEVDALRGELLEARAAITAVTDQIDSEVSVLRETVDQFTAGLPIN